VSVTIATGVGTPVAGPLGVVAVHANASAAATSATGTLTA
jgi:hypothetical protein